MSKNSQTKSTNKTLQQLLPSFLRQMVEMYQERPDLLLAAWPEIIGEKLAPMTKAVSFEGGILCIKVKNSTLLSLLAQHEKEKLLRSLRMKFPSVKIRNIVFRIG